MVCVRVCGAVRIHGVRNDVIVHCVLYMASNNRYLHASLAQAKPRRMCAVQFFSSSSLPFPSLFFPSLPFPSPSLPSLKRACVLWTTSVDSRTNSIDLLPIFIFPDDSQFLSSHFFLPPSRSYHSTLRSGTPEPDHFTNLCKK